MPLKTRLMPTPILDGNMPVTPLQTALRSSTKSTLAESELPFKS